MQEVGGIMKSSQSNNPFAKVGTDALSRAAIGMGWAFQLILSVARKVLLEGPPLAITWGDSEPEHVPQLRASIAHRPVVRVSLARQAIAARRRRRDRGTRGHCQYTA